MNASRKKALFLRRQYENARSQVEAENSGRLGKLEQAALCAETEADAEAEDQADAYAETRQPDAETKEARHKANVARQQVELYREKLARLRRQTTTAAEELATAKALATASEAEALKVSPGDPIGEAIQIRAGQLSASRDIAKGEALEIPPHVFEAMLRLRATEEEAVQPQAEDRHGPSPKG